MDVFCEIVRASKFSGCHAFAYITVSVIVWMEYKKCHRITLRCTVFCACLLLVNGIVHVGQFLLYSSYVPGVDFCGVAADSLYGIFPLVVSGKPLHQRKANREVPRD